MSLALETMNQTSFNKIATVMEKLVTYLRQLKLHYLHKMNICRYILIQKGNTSSIERKHQQ